MITPDQFKTIRQTTKIASSLSLVGSIFILISWLVFKTQYAFTNRLVVYLALSDFFASIAFLWGTSILVPGPTEPVTFDCYLQGSLLQFFVLSSILWTTIIAYNLYQVIAKRNEHTEANEKWYHLICWGLPSVCVGVAFATETMGSAGLWCWVIPGIQRFYLFYFWLFICFGLNLYYYISIVKEVKSILRMIPMGQQSSSRTKLQVQSRLSFYVLTFLLCWVWGSINRSYQYLNNNDQVYWLFLMHAAGSPATGFFNSIVYGTTNRTAQHWLEYFKACIWGAENNRVSRSLRFSSLFRPGASKVGTNQFYSINDSGVSSSTDDQLAYL